MDKVVGIERHDVGERQCGSREIFRLGAVRLESILGGLNEANIMFSSLKVETIGSCCPYYAKRAQKTAICDSAL